MLSDKPVRPTAGARRFPGVDSLNSAKAFKRDARHYRLMPGACSDEVDLSEPESQL